MLAVHRLDKFFYPKYLPNRAVNSIQSIYQTVQQTPHTAVAKILQGCHNLFEKRQTFRKGVTNYLKSDNTTRKSSHPAKVWMWKVDPQHPAHHHIPAHAFGKRHAF